MKGLHNMIDRWRYDWDSGGWKMKGKDLQAMLAAHFQMLELCREGNEGNEGGATPKIGLDGSSKGDLGEPPRVLPVERLRIDIKTLNKLTAPAAPLRVRLWAQDVLLALYLTGDASRAGFGSALIK